jgi:hypothetical protein
MGFSARRETRPLACEKNFAGGRARTPPLTRFGAESSESVQVIRWPQRAQRDFDGAFGSSLTADFSPPGAGTHPRSIDERTLPLQFAIPLAALTVQACS